MFRFKYIFAVALAFILPIVTSAQVSATVDAPAAVRPGDEFRVSITVNKSGIDGFAKLEHKMSSDFMVAEEELAASTFKYSDGKVKYLWMALPSTDAFTVSYLVTAAANMSGAQILEGTFSYVQNNDTKKYQLPKAIVLISADAIASSPPAKSGLSDSRNAVANEASKQAVSRENTRTEGSLSSAERTDMVNNRASRSDSNGQNNTATQSVRQNTAIPVSDAYKEVEGLVYRVQVLAGYDFREARSISSKYGLTEELTVTEHDGMYKYVLGEFNQYRAAKALSNELRNTTALPGPFVVAYKDGYRITTAEALDLITENLNQLEQIIKDKTSQIGQ